jgi:hypothetical protein
VFEEYDTPGIRTVAGIADFGTERVAWFRDPDGNLLSIDDARFAPTPAQATGSG